jgi:hypothetical protein
MNCRVTVLAGSSRSTVMECSAWILIGEEDTILLVLLILAGDREVKLNCAFEL